MPWLRFVVDGYVWFVVDWRFVDDKKDWVLAAAKI